jgi:hypothetical protein
MPPVHSPRLFFVAWLRVQISHLADFLSVRSCNVVEEADDRGGKTPTTAARDNRRGIPQGSPISTLLASLYMRRLVLGLKMLGPEGSLSARIGAMPATS